MSGPAWLDTMCSLDGTSWSPSEDSNANIASWMQFIAATYPDMASYCNAAIAMHGYFSWCGATVGYCLAKNGIRPVFGAGDVDRFLYAMAWLEFGDKVSGAPQPGDIVIFDFGGGDHHVTLFESDAGGGKWNCHGGNQSHTVKLSTFRSSSAMGVRRPSSADSQPSPQPMPTSSPQRFNDSLAVVLKWEGGNDDDPRDPGGRTSRGILQREWNVWRKTHSGLPSDVWQAPQDQIVAIYKQNYWDAMSCGSLPPGVDLAVFDYGVNSGESRAAKALQNIVGADVDGQIGPLTIAATTAANATNVINQICDQRLSFLRGLSTWSTFGKGWSNRIADVRAKSLAAVGEVITPTEPTPMPDPTPVPVPIPAPSPPVGGGSAFDPAALGNFLTQASAFLKLLAEERAKQPPPSQPTQPSSGVNMGAALGMFFTWFLSVLPQASAILAAIFQGLVSGGVVGAATGSGATPTGTALGGALVSTFAVGVLNWVKQKLFTPPAPPTQGSSS